MHAPPATHAPFGTHAPPAATPAPLPGHAPPLPPATRAVKISGEKGCTESGELGLKLNKESESDESEDLDEFEICLLVEMWIVAEVIKELNSRTSPGDNSASYFAL